jgi:UDP-glucose 4-epimerase
MKILVTGGAGYIGSIASEQLCKAGYEGVVFDSLYQGHRAAVPSEADSVEGDLSDRAAIDHTLAEHRPDAVMHFAAFSLVGESMQKPFKYLAENVANSTNLLQSMMEHGVKRFIFSSTANLFDKPERIPIAEDNLSFPRPYGESVYH